MLARTLSIGVAASALVAGLGVVVAAPAASAAPAVRVVSTFPNDRLTVPDRSQLTGRRVALPLVDCQVRVTACEVARLLNELDGFDLDPRLSLAFDRAVDPTAVAAATTITRVRGPGPALSTGVDRVVYDAKTTSIHMHPATQLAASTTYRLRVRPSKGVPNVNVTFTTMSATTDLQRMVGQLDSGVAYDRAAIPPGGRGLRVESVVPAPAVLQYVLDRGPATATVTTSVPNVSGANVASYVFGSYLAPSWLTADRVIPQTPTAGSGAAVLGKERLPFVLIVPAGTAPTGGWPVAVFGHGFTRNTTDLFLAASTNAVRGLATIATDVV
ncbi:MAG: Ig-like domain-containing protein, partial [Pseudorhodobacter sp.]|nr:Ig-like domain-containing protein [Frankiaceae bacterium]